MSRSPPYTRSQTTNALRALNTLLEDGNDCYEPHSGPNEIFDYLYIGEDANAKKSSAAPDLVKFRITDIVDCDSWFESPSHKSSLMKFYKLHDIEYLGFAAEDSEEYKIMSHFEEVKIFIDNALKKKRHAKVLIICAKGINRSAALAIAYMMDHKKMNLMEAVEIVKKARGCILKNEGFRRALVDFAAERGYLDGV